MATIAFFILLTLTLSSTIHARDSQFFNKFSTNEQPLNTNQQQQQQQQQQQPEFIPQSKDSDSYGLYGHKSGQLPPSATTNNLPENLPENYNPVAYTTPIHSTTQDIPEEYREYPQPYNYNRQSRMYNSERQGFDDARFMETKDGGNMYNSEMHGMEETRYGMGTRGNGNMNMYNSEKQGMSDTRFLENGKYYYDVNMENLNSNTNTNMNMNTGGFGSRNGYNTQGYYGNNRNSYDRYNYDGGYQNQEYRFNP